MIRILGIACFGMLAWFGPALGDDSLRTVADDDGVLILEGDSPVLRYQRATKSLEGKWPRANYVHPLYDLDGKVITEDFPADHRHHRGVFWAWHQVRVGNRNLGDSWTCKRFHWDVQSVKPAVVGDSVVLSTTVHWKSPDHVGDDGERIPVVRENAKITVRPKQDRYRLVDFEISLLALVEDVKIGGSEDVKGYGGFSPRIVLHDAQRFAAADGDIEPVKTAINAGCWINITDQQRGLAILSSKNNPPPNDLWILRGKRSMQNAVYPGRDPVPLSKVKPTALNYRLVIHRGDLTPEEITKLQEAFDQ